MNPEPSTQPVRRRHFWRWLLLAAGICLTPIVILAAVVVSCLSLDRDAATLRHQVMTATGSGWGTKVQFSVGRWAIDLTRIGLGFVHPQGQDLADARHALGAVRNASVGVYERTGRPVSWTNAGLFADADQAMQKRGWSRLVGVADQGNAVLIYVPRDFDSADPVDLCLAVVNGKELVVLSTTVNAQALGELVARHANDGFKGHLHLAGLRF